MESILEQAMLPLYLSKTELYHLCMAEFHRINRAYFSNQLPTPILEFSTRMKTCAGKCYPKRKMIRLNLNHYFQDGIDELLRTFRHECIHLLVPNHGKEFRYYASLLEVDIHWNSAPQRNFKPWKYWAICPECGLGVSKKMKRRQPTHCPRCRQNRRLKIPMYYRFITKAERARYNLHG